MKYKKNSAFIKPLSFLPSLLLLLLIFGFSAQTGEDSGSLSFRVSLFLVKLFSPFVPAALSEDTLLLRAEQIHLFVRKAAHMTEYFFLTLSLHLPLMVYLRQKLSLFLRCVIAFICTVFFAMADEFHQTLIPGRSGNLTDVCIDSLGAFFANGLLLLLFYFIFKTKTRRESI